MVTRGEEITIQVNTTAEAGLKSLTINNEEVQGVIVGDNSQKIPVTIGTNPTDNLGNHTYSLIVTDLQSQSSEIDYNLEFLPGSIEISDSVEIYDNVEIIPTETALLSTTQQISSGIYVFNSSDVPDLEVDDLIVGNQNGGFLRKVDGLSETGGQVIAETSQATIKQLFSEADLHLDFGALLDESSGRTTGKTTYKEEFNDLKLFEEGSSSISLTGYSELTANINLDLKIIAGEISKLTLNTDGSTLDLDILTSFEVSESLEISDSDVEIGSVTKFFALGYIAGTVEFKLNAQLSSAIESSIAAQMRTRDMVEINFQASYEEGMWTSSFETVDLINSSEFELSETVQMTNELRLKPDITVKLYGVGGPYLRPEGYANLDLGVAISSGDWNAFSDIGYEGVFGLEADVFGFEFDLSEPITPRELRIWEAPVALDIVSGNNQQVGILSSSEPLLIKALDNYGNSVPGVPVHFEITSGNGELSPITPITSLNGAETVFNAGDIQENIEIAATIKNREKGLIDSKTIHLETIESDSSYFTLIIDGNEFSTTGTLEPGGQTSGSNHNQQTTNTTDQCGPYQLYRELIFGRICGDDSFCHQLWFGLSYKTGACDSIPLEKKTYYYTGGDGCNRCSYEFSGIETEKNIDGWDEVFEYFRVEDGSVTISSITDSYVSGSFSYTGCEPSETDTSTDEMGNFIYCSSEAHDCCKVDHEVSGTFKVRWDSF